MPDLEPTYYPNRPGARLRRWVLLAAALILVLILGKALGRESAPGDGLWVLFRWPLIVLAVVGAPLVGWRLWRWRRTRSGREVP